MTLISVHKALERTRGGGTKIRYTTYAKWGPSPGHALSPPGFSFLHPGVPLNFEIKKLSKRATLKELAVTDQIFIPCQRSLRSLLYP